MTKAYFTDTLRSIRRSVGRFISMMLIVFLGAGVFCGFKATYPDMLATADKYYKDNNLFDIRVQSFIGIYDGDLDEIRKIDGVNEVQGAKFVDGYVLMQNDDAEPKYEGLVDIDGSELTIRAYGYDPADAIAFYNGKDDPSYINRLTLLEGEFADEPGECVVTNSGLTTPDGFKIGETIKISGDNESVDYYLKTDEFVIVGIVRTPYYVSFERGTTLAGSGKLGDYIYIPNTTFNDSINYYSEAYITLDDSLSYTAYTDEYDAYVDGMVDNIMKASEDIVELRAAALKKEVTLKVISGEAELSKAEEEVEIKLADARQQLETLRSLAATGDEQIAAATRELEEKYADAQSQLNSGNAEYTAALEKFNSMTIKVAQSKALWNEKNAEYEENKAAYDEGNEKLKSAAAEITVAETEVRSISLLISSTEQTLKTLQNSYNTDVSDLDLVAMADRLEETNPELAKTLRAASGLTAQGMAADAIVEVQGVLDEQKTSLAAAQLQLDDAKAQYSDGERKLLEAKVLLNQAYSQLNESKKQLDDADSELAAYKDQLQDSELALQFGDMTASTEYMTAQAQIALKQTQLAQAKAYLATADEAYALKEKEARSQLLLAKTQVTKGRALLDNLKDATWNVYDRGGSPGYSGYGDAAYNMKMISMFFPIMFFIVAILVCLTVMTRMVEEERTQLGTLKALGYTSSVIVTKYLIYAFFATIFGYVLGVIVCTYGLPRVFMRAWGIMYEMPDGLAFYYPSYIILAFFLSVASTFLATLIACRRELMTNTAALMRPKAPKAGKRVALEKVTFIWKRFSFTSKVTVRNLFRNKKRFITTMVGIMGCTALLVTGFGFYYSTNTIIEGQYSSDKCVANYDLQIVLSESVKSSENSSIVTQINERSEISQSMLTYLKVCRGGAEGWDKDIEVDVFVPESVSQTADYLRLYDHKTGKELEIPDEGALITTQFADDANVKVGDYVTVSWTEGAKTVKYNVLVAGIVENYVFHYVYLSPEYFEEITGKDISFNYLVAKLNPDVNQEQRVRLETAINDMNGVNGSVYTTVIVGTFTNIIQILDIVIAIIIFAASVLAFTVLSTLNNININERVRELATLKVLGFYDKEVSEYIYRENIILTILGVLGGLLFGAGLEKLVVSVLSIEVVTFTDKPFFMMFVFAALITAVFSVIVNVRMHFKLKKISMVESLKSVE